jgi:hypothetical protein
MGWRKLRNEELHLYSLPRRMNWTGCVACKGGKRKSYGVLVEKLEGKRPLGRPRRRWEEN